MTEFDENAVKSLTDTWGWTSPPVGIIENAKTALRISELRSGDAICDLCDLSEAEKENLLQSKPDDKQTLEWLAEQRPELKELIDKTLTLKNRYLYLDDPAALGILAHPIMIQPEVKQYCEKHSCAVLLIEAHRSLLCFGTWLSLVAYRQQGRADVKKNPIRNNLQNEPVYAVCDPGKLVGFRTSAHVTVSDAAERDLDNRWVVGLHRDDPALIRMADLIDSAIEHKATDIYIWPKRNGTGTVKFRIDGKLCNPPPGDPQTLSYEHLIKTTRFLESRSGANLTSTRLKRPADGQIIFMSSVGHAFLRCSFIPVDPGGTSFEMTSVDMRILHRTEEDIQIGDLNIESDVLEICERAVARSRGLIVSSGPTNSGKSTFIAGLIDLHVRLFGDTQKRMSIEDPVERFLSNVSQVSLPQGESYADYFKAFLRHDSNLIWVGEIRDKDVADVAIWAATSGHPVLSTIHADDTILTFRRLAKLIPRDYWFDLIESISLISAQRLIPLFCPTCFNDERRDINEKEVSAIRHYQRLQAVELPEIQRVAVPGNGCPDCRRTGFSGMRPIHECLEFTRELRDILHKGKYSYRELMPLRHRTLAESGLKLISAGLTTVNEVFIKA